MGKYIKNYANKAAYDADVTRPKDSSVVSGIAGERVIYDGKNVFVDKTSANVGDIVVVQGGELKYIKLDTYDATLITVEPIGVVYHRTPDEVRILHKTDLGTAQWAAPFRAKIEGFDLANGGTHTIKVNASEYPFTVGVGATIAGVNAAILAALPTGAGWTVESKTNYVVVQRSYHTPVITTFEVTGGATVTLLNNDNQANLSALLTPYGGTSRNNGVVTTYGGANYDKFLAYYSVSGSEATNVSALEAAPVRRTAFTMEKNPLLVDAYKTYENYIQANMVRYPYSKNAIVDNNGKRNTTLLSGKAFTDDDGVVKPKFPAAKKANEQTAGGVEWWLPSFEEMLILINKVGGTNDPINRALTAISGGTVSNSTSHWTSSETSSSHAWRYYGTTGCMNLNYKTNASTVRAVSAFSL